jgi:hypothetical protein
LGTTAINQYYINDEIKGRLNLGNARYHLVHNSLYSRLLSNNLRIKIYKFIILSVVLHGCKTWSLTLREEHKLRAIEKTVLKRIFIEKCLIIGDWRKLYNEKLHNLYSSRNTIRLGKSRDDMAYGTHGKTRNVDRVLVRN